MTDHERAVQTLPIFEESLKRSAPGGRTYHWYFMLYGTRRAEQEYNSAKQRYVRACKRAGIENPVMN